MLQLTKLRGLAEILISKKYKKGNNNQWSTIWEVVRVRTWKDIVYIQLGVTVLIFFYHFQG